MEITTTMARAISMRENLNVKFHEAHVHNVRWLRDAAEDYTRSYNGDFAYMLKLQAALTKYGKLGYDNQIAGALNCMYAQVVYERKNFVRDYEEGEIVDFGIIPTDNNAAAAAPPVGSDAPISPNRPNKGYYTVCFDDGTHVTIRVTDRAGYTNFAYLSGSDNNSDYTRYCSIFPNGYLNFKQRASETSVCRVHEAVKLIMSADNDALTSFGKAYAMHSGNCYACGRLLTDPRSIELGIGPVCRGEK